jgi:hypothetical protein
LWVPVCEPLEGGELFCMSVMGRVEVDECYIREGRIAMPMRLFPSSRAREARCLG